jgi:hypothetical protein
MTIKTKFNIGDVVWVIHGTVVQSAFVREIDIRVTGTYGHLRYNLGNTATTSSRLQDASIHGTKNFLEENLFKSKVLLVKSL